jgi:hypothetical protein
MDQTNNEHGARQPLHHRVLWRAISGESLDKRQHISIYISYNKHPIHNYKCENNLNITHINDADADNSLLMMIVVPQSVVSSLRTVCLAGAILGTSTHIFANKGATHNIIDLNLARLIDLQEQRSNTTIIIASSNKVTRVGA